MILQIRTKDNLNELLRHGSSPAWVIAEYRLANIKEVQIFQFDGKKVLKGVFSLEHSRRNSDGRLVVAFTDGVIENCDQKWIGQNPVKYLQTINSGSKSIEPSCFLEKHFSLEWLGRIRDSIDLSHDELGKVLMEFKNCSSIDNYPGYFAITEYSELLDELKSRASVLFEGNHTFQKTIEEIENQENQDKIRFINCLIESSKMLHRSGGRIITSMIPNGGYDNDFLFFMDEEYQDELILFLHFVETLNNASGWFDEFSSDFECSWDDYLENHDSFKEKLKDDSSMPLLEIKEDPFFGNTVESNYQVLGWSEEFYRLAQKGILAARAYC